MDPRHFFSELQRRNVYKVAVAYGVFAWLLIQIATQTFPFFEIPNWVVRAVILLLLLGFPIALVFAWVFELTPEGLKRTDEVPPNESITHKTGRRLMATAGVVTALAVALLLFRLAQLPSKAIPSSGTGSSATAGSAVIPEKSIAVLPFANLSANQENGYFTDGVQDEILTTLAKIADLKVISHGSVMQYRNAEKRDLREIARQLGVTHLLEGSVQRMANRVRVTAQLIDARTDSHIWAEHYDRDLADVFGIQTEIAQKIAGQLKAALSPKEQAALQTKPTQDTAAYDFYLQAKEMSRALAPEASESEAIQKEIILLDQAVARDPAFVPALCLLARVHLQAYWWNHDHTPMRLDLVRKAIEAAARLQPDAGEVHLARALFHYWGHRDYTSALAELALARRSLPNDAEVLVFTGANERRQGHWEKAPQTMEEALVLDPRNFVIAFETSHTYHALRRFDDERRILAQILAWNSEEFRFQMLPAQSELEEKADPARLQKVAFGAAAKTADQNVVADVRVTVALAQRDYRAADHALSEYSLPDFSWEGFLTPRDYYEGRIARGLGDTNRAKAAFLRALDRAADAVNARPDEPKALMVVALIEAALGRKEEAVRSGERAVALLPVSSDAVDGATLLGRLAAVYAEVGDTDRALEMIEMAATLPHGLYYGDLELDERFDSIRKDPRFGKILASVAPKSRSH